MGGQETLFHWVPVPKLTMMVSLAWILYTHTYLLTLLSMFVCGEISQLGDVFSTNEKLKKKNCDFFQIFLPFFEIKIIKLARSRPTHFIGCHL